MSTAQRSYAGGMWSFGRIIDRYATDGYDLSVVRHISHRVAVMYRGEIVETGDAVAVTSTPEHPYTRRLLLAAPVPDPARQAERRAARLEFAARQRAAAPPDGPSAAPAAADTAS